MTITLRACRRCGGDTNEREDIQAGIIITCIQCGDVEYPGYVIEAGKRVRVQECSVPDCNKGRQRADKAWCHMHEQRFKRGYSPDSPQFLAKPYRIGYRP